MHYSCISPCGPFDHYDFPDGPASFIASLTVHLRPHRWIWYLQAHWVHSGSFSVTEPFLLKSALKSVHGGSFGFRGGFPTWIWLSLKYDHPSDNRQNPTLSLPHQVLCRCWSLIVPFSEISDSCWNQIAWRAFSFPCWKPNRMTSIFIYYFSWKLSSKKVIPAHAGVIAWRTFSFFEVTWPRNFQPNPRHFQTSKVTSKLPK